MTDGPYKSDTIEYVFSGVSLYAIEMIVVDQPEWQ